MTSLITINKNKELFYNLKQQLCQPSTEIKIISVIGKAVFRKATKNTSVRTKKRVNKGAKVIKVSK